MTDATAPNAPAQQGPTPKPGILDIAPYVGGKSRIEGVAEPMKLSSNENALGAGEKARAAFQAAVNGTKTPAQSMKDAQREADRLLRSYQ